MTAGLSSAFERCDAGVRLSVAREGVESHLEAELAVVAIGSLANTADLQLEAAGVETDRRGFVAVDDQMRTSAPHVFAAGDITGRAMLVHEAMRQGYAAATNAAGGRGRRADRGRSARWAASRIPSTLGRADRGGGAGRA